MTASAITASAMTASGTEPIYGSPKVTTYLKELEQYAQETPDIQQKVCNALKKILDKKYPQEFDDIVQLGLLGKYTSKLNLINGVVHLDESTMRVLNESKVKDKQALAQTWQKEAVREVKETMARLKASSAQSDTPLSQKTAKSLVPAQQTLATVASARPVQQRPAAATARAGAPSNPPAPLQADPVQATPAQAARQQPRQVATASTYADSGDEGTRAQRGRRRNHSNASEEETRARRSASRRRYRASQKATRDRLKGELADHKAELQAAYEKLAQADKEHNVNTLVLKREIAKGNEGIAQFKEAYTRLECNSKIAISELKSRIVQLEAQIAIFEQKEKMWEQPNSTNGSSAAPSQSNHIEVEFYTSKLSIITHELEAEKTSKAVLEGEKNRLASDRERLEIRLDALQEKHDELKEERDQLKKENDELRRSQVAMQYQGFQAPQAFWYPAQYQYNDGEQNNDGTMDMSQMHYGQYMGAYHPAMNGMQQGMGDPQTMHSMMMGPHGHGHGYYWNGQMEASQRQAQNNQGAQPQETSST